MPRPQSLRARIGGCKGGITIVSLAVVLSACAENGPTPPSGQVTPTSVQASGPARVGLILPLSGRNARLGHEMANAAALALPASQHAAQLDVRDSDGPGGAAGAARDAIGSGDRIILGPLTAAETSDVSSQALSAGIPELAYTSDSTRAHDGIWVMGLTPEQQVGRLVTAAHAQGRTRFAAFLPDTPFGHVLGDALASSCSAIGVAPPTVVFHGTDEASILAGLKTLSAIDTRQAPSPASSPAPATATPGVPNAINPVPDIPAPSDTPAASGQAAATPAQVTVAPPPFDALLLGDTGLQLATVIRGLRDDKVDASSVRILAPALWGAFASKLGALHGAWFAAPEPSARNGYVQAYRRKFGSAPTPLADVAYDTAAMAGALAAQPDGLSPSSLMRADGFAGVNGVFVLKPGGRVARGLAIFEIQPGGGASIVQPAPKVLNDTPS